MGAWLPRTSRASSVSVRNLTPSAAPVVEDPLEERRVGPALDLRVDRVHLRWRRSPSAPCGSTAARRRRPGAATPAPRRASAGSWGSRACERPGLPPCGKKGAPPRVSEVNSSARSSWTSRERGAHRPAGGRARARGMPEEAQVLGVGAPVLRADLAPGSCGRARPASDVVPAVHAGLVSGLADRADLRRAALADSRRREQRAGQHRPQRVERGRARADHLLQEALAREDAPRRRRPNGPGPSVKKNVARIPRSARISSSRGMPSRVPRNVSQSTFSATRAERRHGSRRGDPQVEVERAADPLVERDPRLPAQDALRARRIDGHARQDVLVALAVVLGRGDVHDPRAAGALLEPRVAPRPPRSCARASSPIAEVVGRDCRC